MKILIFLTIISNLHSADILDFIRGGKDTSVIIAGEVAEKKHQLSTLKDERDNLESSLTDQLNSLQSETDKLSSRILEIQSNLKKAPQEDRPHLNDLLNILRDIAQSYNDLVFSKKQLVPLLDQQIKLLQEYISNPNFSNLHIEPQSYYSFETLETLGQKILNFEESVSRLQDEKVTIEAEFENRKKDLTNIEKDLKITQAEQKQFTENTKFSDPSSKQNAELIDLKVQSLEIKKKLAEAKIKESSVKLNVVSVKIIVAQTQLNVVKQDLKVVERKLRVYESDIEKDNQKIDLQRKETINTLAKLSNQMKTITDENQSINEELNEEIKQLNLTQSTLNALTNWSIDTRGEKLETENKLFKIGYLQDKTLANEYNLDLIEAKKEYAQNKLSSEEVINKIISIWHKITQKKLKTDIDELTKIKNEFESIKKDEIRQIALYKDKINAATSQINNHAKILNTIKDKVEELKRRKSFYKEQNAEKLYQDSLAWLKKTEEEISKQINHNGELIKVYFTILANIRDTKRQVEILISMLDRIGGSVLYRSEYAISLSSLKSVLPELKIFIADSVNILTTYITY